MSGSPPSAPAERGTWRELAGAPLRVLLIDDEESSFAEIKRALAEAVVLRSELVWTATTGTGSAALATGAYDICLLDRRVGNEDSLPLIGRVRKSGGRTPVIVLADGPGEWQAAIEAGAVDCLHRGEVSPRVLERSIGLAMLARRASGRALAGGAADQPAYEAQKMEVVGRLAGGVAHDFNNVLTVILGHVDALKAQFAGNAAVLEDLGEIEKSAEYAALLTHQLLAFARREVLQPRVVDLNSVVLDTDRMLERILGEDIHLETDLAGTAGSVHADPGHLKQVLLNLVVNAREAMPNGGTLTVRTANVDLKDREPRGVLNAPPGPYVMLSVADTGVGMSAAVRAHLFEPFFTTKGSRGTGLGLVTIHGIVQRYGGDIWVQSELGQGTTVTVLLPRVGAQPQPAIREEAASTRGTERVLLVEDEAGVATLLATVLKQQGYDVLQASSAEEALTTAGEFMGEIDLLVTDMVMPGMNGRALASRLEQLRPGIKTIFMSGYTDHASVGPELLEPGVHFLQKPFTPLAFARKVRDVLDGT